MSHPLFWLTKQFFYPIGNTAAVSLTQDLSPEQAADILLLGCGDPRSILFTVYADLMINGAPRKMDVTCCDIEPSILARNILLFSMLEDDENMESVWDIFYHFKIDDRALKLLTHHSQQLYESAQTIDLWRSSRYNTFLKMVDTRTLAELCSRWKSYAEFPRLPAARMQRLRREQSNLSKSVLKDYPYNPTPGRSAGMLWGEAMTPVAKLFQKYWETGTTFSLTSDVKLATNLNPTFIYSLTGEVFNPHYASFPAGFLLMPAFAPITTDPAGPVPSTGSAAINVAKQQFKAWCQSFRTAREAQAITIRVYSGEAIAFCHALKSYATTGDPATNIFASPWRAPQIILDEFSASTPQAPTTFDIVDTSNLTDYLGLLNLLIATQPLLKKEPVSQSILFTETLLPFGEDATQSFLERICTDVPTIGLLLGIVPRAYSSTFTTQSNVHELLMAQPGRQFHERVAWVDPAGGDHYSCANRLTIALEVEDLARAIFGIYDNMFAGEKVMTSFFSRPSDAKLRAMGDVHFQRETAALLFRLIQSRVRVQNGNWDQVGDRFLEIIESDGSRLVESNNYQDLCLQLHLYGIHSVSTLQPDMHDMFRTSPRSRIFDDWPSVPPVVCVVLTVPRKSLEVFLDDPEHIGSPTVQGFLRVDNATDNTYSAIHAIWGKCVKLPSTDKFVIQEDIEGINGQSDLVVSFWAHTRIVEFPGTQVALGVKSTPQSTMVFVRKLGMFLEVFRASVTDEQHVQILTYRPALASESPQTLQSPTNPLPDPPSEVLCQAIANEETGGHQLNLLSMRLEIESVAEQESLLNGTIVSAMQIGPCTMEVVIEQHRHSLSYPYPVKGSDHKLRVARKSHYVEVVVPVSRPSDQAGYFLNPFPIIRRNAYTPWNIHHVNLDRLPVLDTKVSKKVEWLDPHCALQLSDRERAMVNGSQVAKAAAANVLVNVKESIHAIMVNVSGVQGHRSRALALSEPGNGGVYMILLVGGIRLDLASSTVTADTAVVPLSNERMPHLLPGIQKLQNSKTLAHITTTGHEVAAWKKLIPAFVERCRTWEHKPNCEYKSQQAIPLSVKNDENPICTCGQGIGFTSSEWKVPEWKDLLLFATRAAISPIFSVSYIARVAGEIPSPTDRASKHPSTSSKPTNTCWACGGPGKPNLSACGRCKKARYCSTTCQRQDWKEHKKDCQAA